MRRRYPRRRASFPRYHPPYPIPYADIPQMRDYTVNAEPWSPLAGFTVRSYPQQGIRTVRSPYIEDPYLNTAEDIRYNTIEPLIDPIPYTYGNEIGSYNRGNNMDELEIDLLTTNAAVGSANQRAMRMMPTKAMMSSLKPKQTTNVRADALVSSLVKRPVETASFILDRMDIMLNDLPPRTTTRFSAQAQQQTALKPIMAEIPAIQAGKADQAVAKKEKNKAILITAIAAPLLAVAGFFGLKYLNNKKSGGSNHYDYY